MANGKKKVIPIPHNINWHEGMLLSQHHFQQNDLRNFRVLASQLKLLSSNHFGVRHLRTDAVALSEGIYRIREIEAVFPDGLIFSYFPSTNNLKPLEINLKAVMQSGQTECTLYLAIAESSDDISPILGSPARYYSIDGDLVSDDNIKENEIRIPRLFPNAFLYAGDNIPELCIGFPLCKIIRLDGVYQIKNWTPPCFFIERHFPLWERCERLAISIREKAVYLSEKMKYSASDTSIFDAKQILEQIITVMPGLEALVYSNEIRPYELYQELSRVLGAVSVLIPTDIIPVMMPYNHNDIDSCLYNVINLIEHYISSIERGFAVSSFKRKERFFYRYMSLEDIENSLNNKLFIGVRSENAVVSDVELWMNDAIIVSDSALEKVRNKRIKGCKRQLLGQDMVARILPGVGVVLFEIEIDKNFVTGEENLHIFNPGNKTNATPTEIMLYIPRKTQTINGGCK
ncbi:MAG: type VI secretion system baseplate subunit TssK [Alphaproteobacteria bacterium]|nr:type VI secretion system baseplate subunit TssK [Alphaproteobacteria bacterium]